MPKKQLKLTDCKGWGINNKLKEVVLEDSSKKSFVSLLDLPSFIHLDDKQLDRLKEYIYK